MKSTRINNNYLYIYIGTPPVALWYSCPIGYTNIVWFTTQKQCGCKQHVVKFVAKIWESFSGQVNTEFLVWSWARKTLMHHPTTMIATMPHDQIPWFILIYSSFCPELRLSGLFKWLSWWYQASSLRVWLWKQQFLGGIVWSNSPRFHQHAGSTKLLPKAYTAC